MSFTSDNRQYGEYKHKLSVSEMPSHRHGTNDGWDVSGGTQKNESAYWGVDLVGATSKNANIFPYTTIFFWKRVK